MKKTKPQLDDFDGCKYWNLSKNRYESIIPCKLYKKIPSKIVAYCTLFVYIMIVDHTRVRLHASKMQNSDYINASFIQVRIANRNISTVSQY